MVESISNDPAASLAQALVADLLELSDAELLRELAEEGTDVQQDASAARAIIAAALIRTARVSREPSVSETTNTADSHYRRAMGSKATDFRRRLASNDDMLASELTLAARNGRGLSSRELEAIVEDLRELGALGESDS